MSTITQTPAAAFGRTSDVAHRPLCIVLVVSNLEFGGTQRQVVELANHLDEARFAVHLCSLSGFVPLADKLRRSDTRLHIIKKRFKFDLTVVPRLARLLRRLRADLVHGFLFDADIAARLAGRLAGVGAVLGSERNTNYTLTRRQLLSYRWTRGCVDMIVANSEAGARFNSRMLRQDSSKYRVVHNGVDIDAFAPRDGSSARKALGLQESDPVVGMFASFKPQKNHAMFFAAARRLLDDLPDTRFLLVGDELHGGLHGSDAYKQRMVGLLDELGLRERCLCLGNQVDVARLYNACDVTVLPSLHEGTPNVLLESMACAVPVVATNVSDNAHIVPHDKAGYLVEPGDDKMMAVHLREILTNHARRREMGTAARQWVTEMFSTKVLALRMGDTYESLLATRSVAGQPRS